jgi:hypothetical protein
MILKKNDDFVKKNWIQEEMASGEGLGACRASPFVRGW